MGREGQFYICKFRQVTCGCGICVDKGHVPVDESDKRRSSPPPGLGACTELGLGVCCKLAGELSGACRVSADKSTPLVNEADHPI